MGDPLLCISSKRLNVSKQASIYLFQSLLIIENTKWSVHVFTQIGYSVKDPKEYECTWKAAGWMERERSLLLWRSRYSRFRTEVRASPGMLRMEFFSRCSSTRLRGRPLGTTLRLLFDKSRHSRLLSWLPGERQRKSLNQFSGPVWCAFSVKLQHGNSHSLCGVDALVTCLKTHAVHAIITKAFLFLHFAMALKC